MTEASLIKSELVSELCNFIRILDEIKVNYCLIGGLAVVVRAYERTTKDIDFAILISEDTEAEKIIREVRSEGYQVSALLENKDKNIISTVRLATKNKKIIVDLLFNSCGIETEVISKATKVEIFNSAYCKVATLSSLIAMKTLSSNYVSRLQDIIDLQYLILEALPEELIEAEQLISLIESRGFNRNEDLLSKYFKIRDEVVAQ